MLVPIIMGSKTDLPFAQRIAAKLEELGVPSELRIASAHKATKHCLRILREYEADSRPKVYITVAGRSNALSAVVDTHVVSPVIACPPYSDKFGGADIYSSLRMPSGVAPAVVLEPEGAALLAVKMLSLVRPALANVVQAAQREATLTIEADDASIGTRPGEGG